ncbi:SGNH/GDSL hydrolase family protein [Exiguobacterium flavidum]|uniref:SGNH/GDSL hydrolase family protein n=1 Tax=Exiguobacterium flavidum TaxID=2184695 RepID=UPI000DF82586|nr:SGNH/GDSL hydrolase family protein [Exiguobacterium flavidum]
MERFERTYEGGTWLTLGDSITWQDSKPYKEDKTIARGYQTLAREVLGFSEIVNKAVPGDTMAERDGAEGSVVRTGLAQDYTVDLVTIFAGTNDFKLGTPLGRIESERFDTTTFCGAYQTLLEHILKENPEQRIFLMTPLQRDKDGHTIDSMNKSGHRLIDYVEAVRSVGERYSVPVIDLFKESGLTKLNLERYTWDGLHPNDAGYERISRVIIGQLLAK